MFQPCHHAGRLIRGHPGGEHAVRRDPLVAPVREPPLEPVLAVDLPRSPLVVEAPLPQDLERDLEVVRGPQQDHLVRRPESTHHTLEERVVGDVRVPGTQRDDGTG